MNEMPPELKADLDYLQHVLGEVFKESDRAVAVVVGAEIDNYLRALLEGYLRPASKKSGRLFEADGALGTFSARIELTYRLGLIPDIWHHDLQVMRKIRNEFAHGGIGTTFDQQKIKDLAKTLLIGKDALPKHLKTSEKESIVPAKTYFMLAAAVLLAQIKILRFNAPRLPEIWKTFTQDANLVRRPKSSEPVQWPDFVGRLNKDFSESPMLGEQSSATLSSLRGEH